MRARLERFWRFACLCSMLVLAGLPGFAADPAPEFQLVVHPENPSAQLARPFVSDAFLKKITKWDDGEAIRPVDLRADSSVRRRFSDSVLKRSVLAVKTYWQQRIFSGRGVPPPELESDDAVVRYVLGNRGAVGYVSGSANVGKLRVVRLN